jgi:hypothetical protein
VSITLGSIALCDGLRWADEYTWTPVAQSVTYSLSGALIREESTRLAGRPLTLEGGRTWAWLPRADLDTLRTALLTAGATWTLTLHDGRSFTVCARHDDTAGPLSAAPVPIVRDSGPADPDDDTWYYLDAIRLLILAEL